MADQTAATTPTVADLLASLRAAYAEPTAARHELAVEQLLRRCVDDPPTEPEWYRSVFTDLDDRAACAFDTEAVAAALDDEPRRGIATGRARRYAALAGAATVLADASIRYPGLERRTATQAVNEAARRNLEPPGVRRACKRVYRLARGAVDADAVRRLADAFVHPDDTTDAFESLAVDRLADGDIEGVRRLRAEVRATIDREWEQVDLLAFSPTGFEDLLAACWREYRNAAATTKGSQDRGVDVVVRTDDGRRLAVQAKRYQPSNPVGIATVQRTAGLTREFDLDRAVVVTSGRFTAQAVASAEATDAVRIVDGERLCGWLTASSLAPPFVPTREDG